jgi:hypothetical protein
LKHCGQKFGTRGRAAVVYACFVTEQLRRPEKATLSGAFSEAEIETWRMVAIGVTSKDYAARTRISHDEGLGRVRALRQRVDDSCTSKLSSLAASQSQANATASGT